MSSSQKAAMKRLEELFRDVKMDQNNSEIVKIENRIDRCCDIHGKHFKENCAYRLLGSKKDLTGKTYSPSRRGSLGLPMSPPRRDFHPSSFPNSLRKDPLGASTGTIDYPRKDYLYTQNGSSLRRDHLGKSVGCLKKDTVSSYNSPLRRDYVAKSMSSLPRPSTKPSNSSLFTNSESHGDLKNDMSTINVPLKNRNGTPSLKSCLAGSNGNSRSNLNVTLPSEPVGKEDKVSSLGGSYTTGRRGSHDKRRFSVDSLENLRRNSWDRRGSSGSSGGWDDPIWEEGCYDTNLDRVRILMSSSLNFKKQSNYVGRKIDKI